MEALERFKTTARLLPRAARIAIAASPRGMTALVLLTLLSAGIPPAIAWVGKALVDAVVARSEVQAEQWVLVEVALVTALLVLGRSITVVRQTVGAKLGHDVNVRILDKATTLELSDFESPAFYDQLTRARREASSRPIAVVTESFDLTRSLLTLSGYAALLVGYSPLACLALAIASIPATVSERYFGRLAFRMRNWRSPDTRKLFYLERVIASDDHAKELKMLGVGPVLLERYKTLGQRVIDEDAALARRRFVWGTLLSLLATGVYYGVYATMVLSAARGRITVGELTLYAAAFRQGQQSFEGILGSVGGMHEHALYLSNLFSYLDRERVARPVIEVAPARDAEGTRKQASLELVDVSYRYPGTDAFAVRHVSLKVEPGKSLALVGFNGAGKSTLVKLILGLYPPSEGRVLLDGRDVYTIPEKERTAAFSVVFQDFVRYQLSLRENVAFGNVEHLGEEERVLSAIERGGATAVLSEVPKGLDAQLGKLFDGGVELSGGQWQTIALSRSFTRDEAPILILDEPTSALDAEAEYALFERFRSLTDGRTSILISHRFPTVRKAHHIVVLDHGEVREEGTHEQLVERGGTYARLFALQREGYL